MDFEYLIIGLIFLITGVTIIIYNFRYHTIKDDREYIRLKYLALGVSITLLLMSINILWNELKKII